MKFRILIASMFLLGVIMIAYPWVDRAIQDSKQARLLSEWSNLVEVSEPLELSRVVYDSGIKVTPLALPSNTSVESAEEEKPALQVHGMEMLGTIRIPSIDAYEPILPDATQRSLKVGVGSVVPGIDVAGSGNLVLAGHRSRTHGKQFSRLNELTEKDEIIIESAAGSYVYQVTDSFLVEPDDLSVLAQDGAAHELTLITCHPVRNPTHRLIIKAEMQ